MSKLAGVILFLYITVQPIILFHYTKKYVDNQFEQLTTNLTMGLKNMTGSMDGYHDKMITLAERDGMTTVIILSDLVAEQLEDIRRMSE